MIPGDRSESGGTVGGRVKMTRWDRRQREVQGYVEGRKERANRDPGDKPRQRFGTSSTAPLGTYRIWYSRRFRST